MENPTCTSMDNISGTSPCLESYPGLGNFIIVVNQGDQEIALATLQKIADEQNVSVSDIKVLTKESYDQMMQYAMIGCHPVPDALDELSVRYSMKVPELSILPNDRDDNRPWYNRFEKRRKGRR